MLLFNDQVNIVNISHFPLRFNFQSTQFIYTAGSSDRHFRNAQFYEKENWIHRIIRNYQRVSNPMTLDSQGRRIIQFYSMVTESIFSSLNIFSFSPSVNYFGGVEMIGYKLFYSRSLIVITFHRTLVLIKSHLLVSTAFNIVFCNLQRQLQFAKRR